MELTDGIIGVSAVVGLFMTPVVSFLKSKSWSSEVKQLVALGISFVAALVVSVANGDFTFDNFEVVVANLGVVFGSSQIFYNQYFGKTGINERIESAGVK